MLSPREKVDPMSEDFRKSAPEPLDPGTSEAHEPEHGDEPEEGEE